MSRKLWIALINRASWKRFAKPSLPLAQLSVRDFEMYRVHCRQTIWGS